MFSQWLFDLKRLWRAGFFWLLLVLAGALALGQGLMEAAQPQWSQPAIQLVEGVSALVGLLQGPASESPSAEDYLPSPGQELFYSGLTYSEDGYTILYTEADFVRLERALEMDQVPLTPEEALDLRYAQEVYAYIDQQRALKEDYSFQGAVTSLVLGDGLLYGLAPLLAIALALCWLGGDDFQGRTSILHRYLPLQRGQVVLARWLIGIFLGAVYLVFLAGAMCLVDWSLGQGLGDLWIPLRQASNETYSLAAILVLARIWGLFTVKLALVASVTLVLSSWIRRTFQLAAGLVFALVIGSLATLFYVPLQASWNILHFPYLSQVLGQRQETLQAAGTFTTQMVDTRIEVFWLVFWLVLALACLCLAAYFFQANHTFPARELGEASRIHRFTSRAFGQQVEAFKLGRFIPSSLVWTLTGLAGASLVLALGLKDYQVRQDLMTGQETDLFEAAVQHFEDTLVQLESYLEDLPPGDQSMMAASLVSNQSSVQQQIEYYSGVIEEGHQRREAFIQGNSPDFYFQLASYYGQFDPNSEGHKGWMNTQPDYYPTGRFPSQYGLDLSLARLQEMVDRGIRPIANSQILLTPYDQPLQFLDRVQERLDRQMADSSVMGIWDRILRVYRLDLVLLGAWLVFCTAGYSIDRQDNLALAWLYTLPEARVKFLQAKVLTGWGRALGLLALVLVMVLGLGLAWDGWGQGDLPMVVYQAPVSDPSEGAVGTYTWTSLWLTTVRSLAYLLANSLFIVSLGVYLSTWIRNHLAKVLTGLGILLLGYLWVLVVPFQAFNGLLPFAYMDLAGQLDNSVILTLHQPATSYLYGWLVTLAWSGIFYLLSWRRVRAHQI